MIDELLGKPFDEAILEFPALREHISQQEDAEDVEEEFRQHWHPEAPVALRQVLEELLDPAAVAANAEETADFTARTERAADVGADSKGDETQRVLTARSKAKL